MLLLSVFGQQDLTRVVSSLGESAQFSQTEVSGTATSKSCRLAHPNGRDFYDLRGVGDRAPELPALACSLAWAALMAYASARTGQ